MFSINFKRNCIIRKKNLFIISVHASFLNNVSRFNSSFRKLITWIKYVADSGCAEWNKIVAQWYDSLIDTSDEQVEVGEKLSSTGSLYESDNDYLLAGHKKLHETFFSAKKL